MSSNASLKMAYAAKYDEFYTELSDIENELRHYTRHFRNKTVLCNCDDPRISKFSHYFLYNFKQLKLKKLIATCYKSRRIDQFSKHDSERAIYWEYTGGDEDRVPDPHKIETKNLKGDGDFRSDECADILKCADIVVTNPPFSLFREYVMQLIEHGKKFIIIGNKNAITYKEVFKLIKEDKTWIGATPMGKDMIFDVPKRYAQELIVNKNKGSGYKIGWRCQGKITKHLVHQLGHKETTRGLDPLQEVQQD